MNNFTTSLYCKAARSSRISLTLSWHWVTKPTLWQSSAWVKLKSPPHPYMKQTSRTVSDDTASKGHYRTAVLTNQNDGGQGAELSTNHKYDNQWITEKYSQTAWITPSIPARNAEHNWAMQPASNFWRCLSGYHIIQMYCPLVAPTTSI